jgi:dephospho-CoA kinase
MLTIGLTGGIASGKSTVAAMFADHGVAIIDTDAIAREQVLPGMPAQFGERVLQADRSLDRRALREIVFADTAKRRQLESILHPRIRDEALRQSAGANGPYRMIVVPLLVESPMRELMDRVLVVDCDQQVQTARLLERDAESGDQARRMIASQASRAARLAIADDIIRNDGTLEDTRRQVDALHQQYLSLS